LKNEDQGVSGYSVQVHIALDVRFASETLAQFKVYTLCCHSILRHYEELSSACSIDTLITEFDEELQNSYCGEEYELAVESVDYSLKKLINGYQSNWDVCAILEAVRKAILRDKDDWKFGVPLIEFRDVGQELAQDFYFEGERTLNKELIETRSPPIVFSNYWLSEGTRPMSSYCDGIYLPFTSDFIFIYYLSYPFMFFHEYASHVYTPDIADRRFTDGWMMYAIQLFLHNRWAIVSKKYPLISAQRNVSWRFWLPKYGRLAAIGYEIACDVDAWINDTDRFLEYTWDLASYPGDLAGHKYFHDDFLELIKEFTQSNTGHLLCSEAKRSADALELYENLSRIRL